MASRLSKKLYDNCSKQSLEWNIDNGLFFNPEEPDEIWNLGFKIDHLNDTTIERKLMDGSFPSALTGKLNDIFPSFKVDFMKSSKCDLVLKCDSDRVSLVDFKKYSKTLTRSNKINFLLQLYAYHLIEESGMVDKICIWNTKLSIIYIWNITEQIRNNMKLKDVVSRLCGDETHSQIMVDFYLI